MIKNTLLFMLLSYLPFLGVSQDFIQRDGKKLMFQEEEILLRGMAFGNLVWVDSYADTPNLHHSKADYQRLEDLGMNAIRFYLNYKTFENDATPYTYKQSGWNWIDQNIQWAKDHGVYLILNMHVPQGGFQSQCDGAALWEDMENQNRLAALWKAIADRYKNEPQIAGYDLVNEPTPSETIESWSVLAQRLIDSIRTVDNNHLLITERAIALDCDYGYSDENNNYPQVTEENMMYTVHLYDPHEYTHQNLDWAGTGDGGKYPDEEAFTLPSDLAYATGDYNNPSIPSGTTPWTYFEGSPFTVTSDDLLVGRVVFLANGIGDGVVYFDDFELKELDANNNEIRTIYSESLTSGEFWWWSENGTGEHTASTDGHNDAFSISVTGNTAAASVIGGDYTFKVTTGNKYAITGWMKGENIPVGATASISTEYSSSPSGEGLGLRNYEFIKNKIISYAQYIEDMGYPVYFGEFGAARTCFVDDKGGERWVSDALHVFDSLGYHFTYHSYKESSFGYYDGWDRPVNVNTVNVQLKEVFENFFDTVSGIDFDSDDADSGFQLFPNPSDNKINVNHAVETIHKMELYANTGQLMGVYQSGEMVDVGELESGVYLLSIHYDGGIISKKFIKE